MTRLISWLLGLLRKLSCSAFVQGSIKRLMLLLGFIQRLLSTKRASNNQKSPNVPQSQFNASDLPISICPSLEPPPRAVVQNRLHVPNKSDEYYMTSVHTSTPTQDFFAYPVPQCSHSSQEICNLSLKDQNDTTSIASHRPSGLLSSSLISLPLSKSFQPRPPSRNSQPIKVSRPPSATQSSDNVALPAGVIALPDRSRLSPQVLKRPIPISANDIQRWDRRIIVPTKITVCLVDPLQLDYSDDDPPTGWSSRTHPEGAQYFFHQEKRIYTDASLHDAEEFEVITESAHQILGALEALDPDNKIKKEEIELVLELIPPSQEDDSEYICGYYFVCHERQCLFWLEEFDASDICNEIKVVVSRSHLKHEIESQYWIHWELFPDNRPLEKHLHELRDTILHAVGDSMTSRTSTALLSTEDNMMVLNLLNDATISPAKRDGAACFMGRIMRHITHHRFLHLCGQRGARLDIDQSIHDPTVTPRPVFVMILVSLLFQAPDIHLRSLEKIWVDSLVHDRPWDEFVKQLRTDYQEFSLMATVLLGANMSFLSIQSVDNNGNRERHRSAAQISSYISIVTCLGTIIFALLLSRQNRSIATVDGAAKFLGKMSHKTRGLEGLAILFALPYALLMWSALTFLGAFSFMCFFYSSLATRIPVASVLFSLFVFIAWCMVAAWVTRYDEGRLPSTWRTNLLAYRSRGKLQTGSAEGSTSAGSPTWYGEPVAEGKRSEAKRQWSLTPRFFVHRATLDRNPELQPV